MSARVQRALVLSIATLSALILRIVLPWRSVFLGDFIRFHENDPWYHVRFIENLLGHFPIPVTTDPYLAHPGSHDVPIAPMFDLIVASAAMLLGFGHPSPLLVERVAALAPPVFAALTVVAVFFIARHFMRESSALVAAALAAVLPGQFLQRSLLGFVDHHIAEILFSACAIVFLLAALRDASWRRAAIAGAFLALYCLSWASALFGVALLAIAGGACLLAALFEPAPARAGFQSFAVLFAVASLGVLPMLQVARGAQQQAIVLAGLGAFFAAIELGARWAARRPDPLRSFRWLSCSLLLVSLGAGLLAGRTITGDAVKNLQRFHLFSSPSAIGETEPLLASRPLAFLWSELGPLWLVALFSFAWFLVRSWRNRRAQNIVLAVWTAGVTAAMFGQIRFSYYVALPAALFSAWAFEWLAFRAVRNQKPSQEVRIEMRRWVVAGSLLILLYTVKLAARVTDWNHGPSPAWVSALQWMRSATPEPFAAKDAYRAQYDRSAPISSTYGVIAPWQAGYWITAIARRVPIANPTQQGASKAASFLLAQDEASADAVADGAGADYVIVDPTLTMKKPRPGFAGDGGTLAAHASALGQSVDRYYERYAHTRPDGSTEMDYLFYPEYFRAMGIRLFLHSNAGAPIPRYHVVTFAEEQDERGKPRKRMLALHAFDRYRDAMNAVLRAPIPNRRLVSLDPLVTCIPLEPLQGYQPVFASSERDPDSGRPQVQVFRRGSS